MDVQEKTELSLRLQDISATTTCYICFLVDVSSFDDQLQTLHGMEQNQAVVFLSKQSRYINCSTLALKLLYCSFVSYKISLF